MLSPRGVGTVLEALATVFGVGVDLAGIFAPKGDSNPNVVRIYVGAQTVGDAHDKVDIGVSPGGNAPGVTIWDGTGNLIGTIEGEGKIGDGSLKDYVFDTGSDQRGGQYVSVSASGTDGLCIAGITLTTPENNNFAWFGDTARICGLPWYYSSRILGTITPACAWIDTNADKGHKYNGLSVHLPSFVNNLREPEQNVARKEQLGNNTALMCKSKARFSMWDEIVPQNDVFVFETPLKMENGLDTPEDQESVLNPDAWSYSQPGDISIEPGPGRTIDVTPCFEDPDNCHASGPSTEEDLKEQDPTRRKRMVNRRASSTARIMPDDLVISSFAGHSARELCDDSASEGPDLVSLAENLFCDMSTIENRKQLYPLCSATVTAYCFDMETYTIRGSDAQTTAVAAVGRTGPVSNVAVAAGNFPSKNYTNIQTWE